MINDKIKVSVIIPVYNAEKYLEQAVLSIIGQTLQDIEIICVDDRSTDHSMEILRKFESTDNRIRILQNPDVTDGAARAREIGLQAAKGEYICFMDADDYADEQMVNHAYQKAISTKADIVLFDGWYYDDQTHNKLETNIILTSSFVPAEEVFKPGDYKTILFRLSHGAVWGRLFRADFIREIDLHFFDCFYWDDIEFWYVALCSAQKLTCLRERLIYYRFNADGNQTSSSCEHPEIGYKATYEIKRRFEGRGLYEDYKIPLVNNLVGRAFNLLFRLESPETFNHLYYALRNEYLEKIGAFDIKDEEYINKRTLQNRDLMMANSDVEAFLIEKLWLNNRGNSQSIEDLENQIGKGKKIIIYGAGNSGRGLYATFLRSKYQETKVVAWVDTYYEKIGWPVQSPEVINDIEYDYIFVAIENPSVKEEIKEKLMRYSVPEGKIIANYK